jgi:hypothetical protein
VPTLFFLALVAILQIYTDQGAVAEFLPLVTVNPVLTYLFWYWQQKRSSVSAGKTTTYNNGSLIEGVQGEQHAKIFIR